MPVLGGRGKSCSGAGSLEELREGVQGQWVETQKVVGVNQAEWEGKVCWAERTAVQRPRGRRELGGFAGLSQPVAEGG